jgi:hypothetical protein
VLAAATAVLRSGGLPSAPIKPAQPGLACGLMTDVWGWQPFDLPAQFHGRRGDYQLEQIRSLVARMREPRRLNGDLLTCSPASAAHRAAQRDAFAASQATRRAERINPSVTAQRRARTAAGSGSGQDGWVC